MKKAPELAAYQLLMHYGISRPTLENLLFFLSDLGFDLFDFDPNHLSESFLFLQKELNIPDEILAQSGFTLSCGDIRLVFVRYNLSIPEKQYVLAHELGHIVLDHLQPGIRPTILQEYDANVFAHALIAPSVLVRMSGYIKNHKLKLACLRVALIVFITGGVLLVYNIRERSFYGEYYVTSGGDKYHLRNCPVIQNRTNIHRMTVDEYKSEDYTPCGICLRDSTQP